MKTPIALLLLCLGSIGLRAASEDASLPQRLQHAPFKLVYESYVDGNWELFVVPAGGGVAENLTGTLDENELYPQVSPDGRRICFVSDKGHGRDTVRSVYYMTIDGKNRTKVADHARQPFWHPNGKVIAYLPQEYPKFNVVDFFTKGLVYYDIETGRDRSHPNAEKLHHLYNPNFSPDGKWIVSTVHAGMGFGHAILLIEAEGERIVDLQIPGCRPVVSPTGKEIAWGPGDHELAVAPIDWDAPEPKVGPKRFQILDEKQKIYHVDWSPDGRYLSFSRGPDGKGDPGKMNTHQAACEIVGVYAPGWNLFAVEAGTGALDLNQAKPGALVQLTSDGSSNKESAWFRSGE